MSPFQEICALIPHRPPFLFVDEILAWDAEAGSVRCRKTFSGEEAFFQGHYPDFPLVPGVILCEAAMQAGAALLAKKFPGWKGGKMPVVAKMTDIRFRQMVRPGDSVLLDVQLENVVANAYTLSASVALEADRGVPGKNAVRLRFIVMLT